MTGAEACGWLTALVLASLLGCTETAGDPKAIVTSVPAPSKAAPSGDPINDTGGSPAEVSKTVADSARSFPREFQLTSMRGTSHAPYIDGNTLDAIRAAHQGGIEYIEVDLVLTRDGELVTAHQPNVKDCGTLSKMLLIQIRGCKIGGALRVAELSEILEVPFKGVFLDLKDTRGNDLAHANRAVARAASIVSEKHRQQTAVLMLYQAPPDSLVAIRKQQLRAGLKGYPKAASETLEMVERASALGFEMLSVNAEHVTPELLADSTRLGVWHLPWSTDASAYDHWRALAKAGAGGLIVLHYELAKQQVAPHWTDARSLHLQ